MKSEGSGIEKCPSGKTDLKAFHKISPTQTPHSKQIKTNKQKKSKKIKKGLFDILSKAALKVDALGLGVFVYAFVIDTLILNRYVHKHDKHIHKNEDVQSVPYR